MNSYYYRLNKSEPIGVPMRTKKSFLAWAAEPHLEERHKIGFKAIIYLIILTIFVYFSMKKLWSRIESEV